jgi:hypothetical protein
VAENLDRATPAAAAEAWLVVSDALLRGLNHALSNRAATVGAVSGVLDPAEPPSAAIVDVLRDEAARLDELLQLARLLPGQRAGTEPVHLPDVVPAAVALHGYHFDLRDTACHVEGDATVMPVLADPTALTHALLLLLTAAKLAAAGGTVVLRHHGDDEQVTLTLDALPPAAADDPAVPREDAEPGDEEAMLAAARTLLAASDAVVERRPAAQGARYELTLPTLTAARRAERARRIGLAPSERLGQ